MKKLLLLLLIPFLFYSCKDADKDNVLDKNDKCPNIYGLEEFDGCPDLDGDGIIDREDDCPEEYGLEEFDGCPDTGSLKLIASKCFKIYKLTNSEIEEIINRFDIIKNRNSMITFSMCEIIVDVIYNIREFTRTSHNNRIEIIQKMNELQRMQDEGYIINAQTMTIGGVKRQEIFVQKYGEIYKLSVLGSSNCPMGTVVFDEKNKNVQEVFVRPDPSSLSYQVFKMKIIQ